MDLEDRVLLATAAAAVALIAFGAYLIFVPAAPLLAGVLLLAGVIVYLRGARGGPKEGDRG